MAPPSVAVGAFERLREFLSIDQRRGGDASLVARDRGRVLARLPQGVAQTKMHERICGMGSKRRTQDCDGLLGNGDQNAGKINCKWHRGGNLCEPYSQHPSARR